MNAQSWKQCHCGADRNEENLPPAPTPPPSVAVGVELEQDHNHTPALRFQETRIQKAFLGDEKLNL